MFEWVPGTDPGPYRTDSPVKCLEWCPQHPARGSTCHFSKSGTSSLRDESNTEPVTGPGGTSSRHLASRAPWAGLEEAGLTFLLVGPLRRTERGNEGWQLAVASKLFWWLSVAHFTLKVQLSQVRGELLKGYMGLPSWLDV